MLRIPNRPGIVRLLASALLSLSLVLPASAEGPALAGPDPVGLWGGERFFGPEVRGPLLLERNGESWRLTIAGFEASAHQPAKEADPESGTEADTEVVLELPGNRGTFRSHATADGKRAGFWIQPAGTALSNAFATPVRLETLGPGRWRGQVKPLDDQLTLNLVITRQPDGGLGAFLRNPEHNIGRFLRIERVTQDDQTLSFFPPDGEEPTFTAELRGPDTMTMYFPPVGVSFDLTRRDSSSARGFSPRSDPGGPYGYARPPNLDDGWATDDLNGAGLEARPIVSLVREALATETTGVAAPYLQGLLVARHRKLVLEEYFYGFHRDRPHDTRSAGKSLATTLVGLALGDGAPFEVSTPIYPLLEGSEEDRDPRKDRLTVEHLLTMSPGLECDDNNFESPGNEDRMQNQGEQLDWYRYTLDLPMAREPGAKGIYCSAGMHLLGAVLTHTTGEQVPELLDRLFARPLGIDTYHLNLSPSGRGYLGGGIYLLPRDLLKLGQLFLDGGRWQGRQILDEDWIRQATRPHSSLNEPDDYGYGWWIDQHQIGDRTLETYYASGNGGQLLIVVPELDMVVLFLGGNYGNYGTWRSFREELLPRILGAAIDE